MEAVDDDSGHQKTGDNKEDVDSSKAPAEPSDFEVKQHNGNDRERSQRIYILSELHLCNP